MQETTIEIDGQKVNCLVGGKGPFLLILHGWGGSSFSWKKIAQNLENNFSIICPDFPGFGKTPPPSSVWKLDEFVFWVKKVVNFFQIKKFHLLGHSFGGKVAVKFAISCPQCVEKLILVAPAGVPLQKTFRQKLAFFLAKIGRPIFAKKPFLRFKEFARNWFYFLVGAKDYRKAKGIMREIMKEIIKEDLTEDLKNIKNETLIVWGKKDKILPVSLALQFSQNIKNSKLKILDNVGHSPHLETPDKLSKILIEFLK